MSGAGGRRAAQQAALVLALQQLVQDADQVAAHCSGAAGRGAMGGC